jgi:hypothetical protein
MNAYEREVLECSDEEERKADRRLGSYLKRVAAANGRFIPERFEWDGVSQAPNHDEIMAALDADVSGIDLYNEHKGAGYTDASDMEARAAANRAIGVGGLSGHGGFYAGVDFSDEAF